MTAKPAHKRVEAGTGPEPGKASAAPPFSGIREITCDQERDLDTVAELHMELLDTGPMARLGELFIREICYRALMQAGVLNVAIGELDGEPVGFVAYTRDSFTFHRTGLREHWRSAVAAMLRSLLNKPSRLLHALHAVRVVLSRRSEEVRDPGAHGEVVCIAVRPAFLKESFNPSSDERISEELVSYAGDKLKRAGIAAMRMLVDADNKAVLFLYHSLGARFERYIQAGQPTVQVWFDLSDAGAARPEAH